MQKIQPHWFLWSWQTKECVATFTGRIPATVVSCLIKAKISSCQLPAYCYGVSKACMSDLVFKKFKTEYLIKTEICSSCAVELLLFWIFYNVFMNTIYALYLRYICVHTFCKRVLLWAIYVYIFQSLKTCLIFIG